MSFQVNSTDLKHGTEIKESVATADEEFKNSTAGETDRKLAPKDEEEFKNSTAGETEIKLVPEDEEGLKDSTDEETDRKLIPEDEEEFKKTRTEELKRKLIPEDEDDEEEEQSYEHSELLQPRRKRFIQSLSSAQLERLQWISSGPAGCAEGFFKEKEDELSLSGPCCGTFRFAINPFLKNKDDDEEDKEISRTQSMDNLLLMQKPPHQSQ